MTSPVVTIDPNDMSTLPNDVIRAVLEAASAARGSIEYIDEISSAGEDAFRAAWGRALLRTYHCTRLLPHELKIIRTQGLRKLTPTLMLDRIEAARQSGVLTEQEAAQLHQAHVFATPEHVGRAGQVCLIAGRTLFDDNPGACRRLLSTWGGEALYMSERWPLLDKRIRTLGTPCIVVADIDIFGHSDTRAYPDIFKLFVGLRLQLEDCMANIFYKDDVPAGHIVDIWHPGHQEYDHHANLPRI
jgi:hypothetical protein